MGQPVRQASALACKGSVCHPKRERKKEKEPLSRNAKGYSKANSKQTCQKHFTERPARSAAQPCRYCVYSVVFRPAAVTHCPDKRDIWHGAPPSCQIPRLSGQMHCRNTAPKTAEIWNFSHKFAPQGQLVYTIFTELSVFVCVYRYRF